MAKSKARTVVFFHPDLGIGGAERLVVDAAVGLQNKGHKVAIFTSHCDPTHCFDEARDGTLDVRVRGNNLFPPSILNRFSILCAVLRQLHLVLQVLFLSSELSALAPDVFFIDQLSACIPLLRLLSPQARILFYCHFPDKLLAYRESVFKQIYRIPFDWLESWTTGCSDVVVVNSNFTKGIFKDAFPRLRHRSPAVVYPCVIEENTPQEGDEQKTGSDSRKGLWKGKRVILSINRFERKKNIALAIEAFAELQKEIRETARLVVAGGYDRRMAENVSYHRELENLATSLGLRTATTANIVSATSVPSDVDVLFLLSVPSSLKTSLLRTSSLLAYTPKFEHFGIVPLEAMLAELPVLAAQTGGPRETVVDGHCGWLRDADTALQWTEVMHTVLAEMSEKNLQEMGRRGRARVLDGFSQSSMASRLEEEMGKMEEMKQRPKILEYDASLVLACGCVAALISILALRAFR